MQTREKGVRLAHKMQVGPCIPVGNTSNTAVTCKRLKPISGPTWCLSHYTPGCGIPTRSHIHLKDQCNTPCRTTASSHAVTAGSRPQGSVQHRPSLGLRRPNTQSMPAQRLKCNTPCRTTASPHAVTAGSRLSATPRIYTRPYERRAYMLC